MAYLCDAGTTRETTSVCLPSLLTRPDVEATHLMRCAGTLIFLSVANISPCPYLVFGSIV